MSSWRSIFSAPANSTRRRPGPPLGMLEILEDRRVPVVGLESVTTFQNSNDTNLYQGTVDTMLRETTPTTSETSTQTLEVQSNPGTDRQSLLRFDGIFGAGLDQVPAGSDIIFAELVLNVTGSGDGAGFYRMNQTWQEQNTWNSFTANGTGIQPGTETNAKFFSQAGLASGEPNVPTGLQSFDVTQDLRFWSENPNQNFGWAFVSLGDGGQPWEFSSSEHVTVANRPQLRV